MTVLRRNETIQYMIDPSISEDSYHRRTTVVVCFAARRRAPLVVFSLPRARLRIDHDDAHES